MKEWFGHPFYECECGFTSLDKAEFHRHLARKGHKCRGQRSVASDQDSGASAQDSAASGRKSVTGGQEQGTRNKLANS